LIEGSALLSLIPRSVSDQFCALADITTFELPFPVPSVEISLYTYRRRLPDPGVQWLRLTIREALSHWTT